MFLLSNTTTGLTGTSFPNFASRNWPKSITEQLPVSPNCNKIGEQHCRQGLYCRLVKVDIPKFQKGLTRLTGDTWSFSNEWEQGDGFHFTGNRDQLLDRSIVGSRRMQTRYVTGYVLSTPSATRCLEILECLGALRYRWLAFVRNIVDVCDSFNIGFNVLFAHNMSVISASSLFRGV